jgi:5'-nucleotidase (lipoprotein e(P4) family)
MKRMLGAAASLAMAWSAAVAQSPGPQASREIKYVRDSEEYAALTRQIFRVALRQVTTAREALPRGRPWAVVLDVAQTVLDDAVYMLERRAYGVPHDTLGYGAWRARETAEAVPGAVEFIAGIRRLGGRVAWITNDHASTRDHVRGNLAALGLWRDGDVLCPPTADPAYGKAARRAEVRSGAGQCAWAGESATVLAYVGDAMGDFPRSGETDPDAGNDAAFGIRYFLLPNPMYGLWETRVTRTR